MSALVRKLQTLRPVRPLQPLHKAASEPQPLREFRLSGRPRMRRNARLLRHAPLCCECLRRGRIRAAAEWDHVQALADGGRDTEANLQGLCVACHKAKTAAEAARRSR